MCNHEQRTTILTPHLAHYGKEVCSACGKFFAWVKNPETEKAQSEAERAVEEIFSKTRNERERDFLKSIQQQKYYFTPKQKEWFESLCKNYDVKTPQSYR